jgi:MOSC domain-containing protein YiiM
MASIQALYVRPPESAEAPLPSSGGFRRVRCDDGVALALDASGIVASQDWHKREFIADCASEMTKRGILCQSVTHYEAARAQFSHLREGTDEDQCPTLFGEQVLVGEGMDSTSVCVGDVYHVVRGSMQDATVAVLQVTSPRKPCRRTDEAARTKYGAQGMRAFLVASGQGGWFCQVVQDGRCGEKGEMGHLMAGDRFVLAARPHPEWSLRRVSEVCFGKGNTSGIIKRWEGTHEELRELAGLDMLPRYDWKTEINKHIAPPSTNIVWRAVHSLLRPSHVTLKRTLTPLVYCALMVGVAVSALHASSSMHTYTSSMRAM